jgi:hypothetical protein
LKYLPHTSTSTTITNNSLSESIVNEKKQSDQGKSSQNFEIFISRSSEYSISNKINSTTISSTTTSTKISLSPANSTIKAAAIASNITIEPHTSTSTSTDYPVSFTLLTPFKKSNLSIKELNYGNIICNIKIILKLIIFYLYYIIFLLFL